MLCFHSNVKKFTFERLIIVYNSYFYFPANVNELGYCDRLEVRK